MAGWQKVYRDITSHWLWEDKPFSRGQAFIDLLLMVNHQDKKILFNGDLIEVRRGSKITSLRKLSEEWGWSTKKTKKFLELLEKDNMITVKSDNKKTLITIENYSLYQDSGNTEETEEKQEGNSEEIQKKNKGNSKENQKKTNKKDKEGIKKDNKGKEGEERKEDIFKTNILTFPSPIYESIYNLVGDVGYRTWFIKSEISEDDTAISIKANSDFEKGIIISKYIPRLELEFNKKIEVS
ncbi:hypothetical protein [Clostridium sardiniense]|uniref:hypothetical protein n=1 Tax=Clostridium sardiniense TaxID=29369 RepID=UPI001957CF43|nr:hypothetical protein [Clostridium sardiniense]MBM7835921.1 hypothetical protein [Clostridium sardiniense]